MWKKWREKVRRKSEKVKTGWESEEKNEKKK